jgi:hypothetical protein
VATRPEAFEDTDRPLGPLPLAGRLLLAENSDVPPDSPNIVHLTSPADDAEMLLARSEFDVTSGVARLCQCRPEGGTLEHLAQLIVTGQVVVLEQRVLPKLIAGGTIVPGTAPAEPVAPTPDEPRETLTWVEFVLVDQDDNPLTGESYEVSLPDGSVRRGHFESDGRIRFEGIPGGMCNISFPSLGSRSGR